MRSRVAAALLLAWAARPAAASDADVTAVAGWLAGTFRAESLRRRIVSVPVPKSRIGLGAPVLYVEAAPESAPNRPDTQRFLVLLDGGAGKVSVKVFEPRTRLALVGKWTEPETLALYGPGDVDEKPGCRITLALEGEAYTGGTQGKRCASTRDQARYQTLALRVTAGGLEIVDQGFDASGKRVYGEPSPRPYLRQATPPPPLAVQPTPTPARTPAHP